MSDSRTYGTCENSEPYCYCPKYELAVDKNYTPDKRLTCYQPRTDTNSYARLKDSYDRLKDTNMELKEFIHYVALKNMKLESVAKELLELIRNIEWTDGSDTDDVFRHYEQKLADCGVKFDD